MLDVAASTERMMSLLGWLWPPLGRRELEREALIERERATEAEQRAAKWRELDRLAFTYDMKQSRVISLRTTVSIVFNDKKAFEAGFTAWHAASLDEAKAACANLHGVSEPFAHHCEDGANVEFRKDGSVLCSSLVGVEGMVDE